MRVAIVGGGWAGLSAAVHAVERGHHVTLHEMAPALGGRARSLEPDDAGLDNGQHILVGAYSATISLMRRVGADPDGVLVRMPLALVEPDGRGLRLRPGRPAAAFARAVLARPGWGWRDRATVLAAALGWWAAGFTCPPGMTVAQLSARLTPGVRRDLVEPLCVAALNTPMDAACAGVFLRVLRDAVFGGPGSADLLLPRAGLDSLLPGPAQAWLTSRGAALRLGRRVERIAAQGTGWRVDEEPFDAVVLASSAREAARLAAPISPAWSTCAQALEYEPIVTVYARCAGARLPHPVVLLTPAGRHPSPAQFAFDLGQLGRPAGLFAFVISGARHWVEQGMSQTVEATFAQARRCLAASLPGPLELVRSITEKRATFACKPGLERPPALVGRNVVAAGDYVDGPYPATLEGAVRSGAFTGELLGPA